MAYNYDKLKGRIVEKFGSQVAFAKALGISEKTISNKLSGKRYFTQLEISRSVSLLGLRPKDVDTYFFTLKV